MWLSKRAIPEWWDLYDLLNANEALDVAQDVDEWQRKHPPKD